MRFAILSLRAAGTGSKTLGMIDPPAGILVFEIACAGPGGIPIQSSPRARFGFFTVSACAGQITTSRFGSYHGGRIRLALTTVAATRWKIYVGVPRQERR